MNAVFNDTASLDHPPYQSRRSSLTVIQIAGADAADFLHGQFSGDVRALCAGQTLLTAWCTPKGRVLFLPRLLRDAAGEFHALLPSVQAVAFIKRLRMFVLRAKVQIEDRSASHGVIVIDGAVTIDETDLVLGVDGERRWLMARHQVIANVTQTLALPALDDNGARLSDIRRGEPVLEPTLADQFLPQELNLDVLAGVSFNKGCYPGQEIVARVKFRGAVKRRAQRYNVASSTAPAAGSRIVGADDVAHGTVLASAYCAPGLCEVLAVVELAAGELRLAGEDRALLSALPLPYAITGA